MSELKGFTIRVYGLLENSEGETLVLKENIVGSIYNKFPGGGLELGEGIGDALIREFKEELDLDVELGDHVYTTDYFIESAFRPGYQVIAIYYKVKSIGTPKIMDPDIKELFWLSPSSQGEELHLESDRKAWMTVAQKRRAALIRKRLKQ